MKLKISIWCPILLYFLVACQSPSNQQMRLSSWASSPSETKIYEATLARFRAKNPQVNFKYEPIPGNYPEKIQLMLGTHTAPDLFYLKGMTAPSYMSFQILLPLDELIEQTPTFQPDDFYSFAVEAFQYKGKQYGLPKDFNPYVLFYNKKLFQEANATVPTNWEELVQTATLLTKDKNGNGKTDQFGFIVEPSVEMSMPFVYQNAGHFQNPDGSLGITDEPYLEALEFYYSLYEKGIATIPQDAGVAWNGDAFGREITAMAISGGWLIPFLRDNYPDLEYGVAVLPKGKIAATVAFTTAYAMPKSTQYKKEAWQLLDYLVGPEGMGSWTQSGIAMPTRKSVAKANGFEKHPIYSVFIESAKIARPFQVQYSERGFEEVNVAMQSIFFQHTPPRKAMNNMETQIQRYKLIRNGK